MTPSNGEREFCEKLRVFLNKEGHEIDPQYVAGVLLSMGAILSKLMALNHQIPIGTLMEYINECVNHGLKEGAMIFQRINK